jgi:uncharacterized protein YcbX
MARVVALYRYPVKSLTPEARESLTIAPNGRIAGDRVLGFRFAGTPEADDAWSSKHGMLALVNTPGLARLRLALDEAPMRLVIHLDGRLLVEDELDTAGRERICDAVTEYVLGLDESGLKDRPERLPLRLIGDGRTPRYQDSPAGTVTLYGTASLDSLRKAIGDPELDGLRFRSNIVIDGVEAWEEFTWAGGRLRIGEARFRCVKANVRCLATHANPDTGERDRPVLTTLTRAFGQEQPTFAVALQPEGQGTIRVGDTVEVLS